MDLVELWRARRYRYIWAIVERLPRDSNYVAELADDDDLAAELADEPGEPAPPSLRDFGPDIEQLARIGDLLGSLLAVQVAIATGKKQQPPPPARRPVTAAQRARAAAAERERNFIAAQLWPDGEAG